MAQPCESYPISTVARLTGLSVHTIRAWEKRYSVVEPLRTDTQRRVYSRDQVRKLSLLRALVDAGHPISSVANLGETQLEQRLDSAPEMAVPSHATNSTPDCQCLSWGRIGVVGPSLLSTLETQAGLLPAMEVCCAWESLDQALVDDPSAVPLDLLLVETETLFADGVGRIRDLAARSLTSRVVIVYAFAPQETVAMLNRTPRFVAVRWPVNVEELRLAACRTFEQAPLAARAPLVPVDSGGGTKSDAAIPPRIFTPKKLARLSRMSSAAARCECPQHLANLITSLAAFETYTTQCENRDKADENTHAMLRQATAIARSQLENALTEVLDREGIQL